MIGRSKDKDVGTVSGGTERTLRSAQARLGEFLVQEGIITRGQLDEALVHQRKIGGFLGKALIDLDYIDQSTLISFLVKQCKIPHISLLDYEIDESLFQLVPRELCRKYRLLPIDKLGRILTVAMIDPFDAEALEQIRAACPDLKIKPILCDWQHYESIARQLWADATTQQQKDGMATYDASQLNLPKAPSKPVGAVDKAVAAIAQGAADAEDDLPVVEPIMDDAPTNRERTTGSMATGSAPRNVAEFRKDAAEPSAQVDRSALDTPGLGVEGDEVVRKTLAGGRLDRAKTFGSYRIDDANRVTAQLASAIAARPNGTYSPLFLYGGTGTGKSHLLHALGNAARGGQKHLRVGFFTAGSFLRNAGTAMRRDAVDTFHETYVGFDALLLDDVQALSERRDAQEELLGLLEAFAEADRLVALTGSMSPDRLDGFDARLISRFAAGIVAQVKPPGLEARTGLLDVWAKEADIKVAADVLELIASRIPEDLRRMGGALRKVIACATLGQQEITSELAGEVLEQLGVTDAA